MAHKPKLGIARHLQSVVECRYPRAHRYWDDCGKLVEAIEATFPGLTCQALERDGFAFSGASSGITGAKFFWDKAVVSQVGVGDSRLAVAVSKFWSVVREGLSIRDPLFLGHRTWLCYETANTKEALRWLDAFRLWTFADQSLLENIGAPLTNGVTLRTQLDPDGRRLRLNVGAGTMSIEGKEYHGVIADVDIVVQPPAVLPADFGEYVAWNLDFVRTRIEPVFRSK